MERRSFLRTTGLTAGLMAISSKELLARLLQENPYKIKMLRGDVGIFSERGGTIGFHISKDGFVVIDSQFPDQSKHLIAELKKKNELPFKMLINTHHHGDHTGGNISFKDITEHVAGHENCLLNYKRVAQQSKTVDKQLFQDITFGDTWKYKIGKERIKTHYFGPAHTNGDIVVHFEHANIAHMGDLLFNQMHPFIDRTAGASISNWMKVLPKIRSTFDNETVFVFGHATDPEKVTGTKQDLLAFEDYLDKLITFVGAAIKAGQTKEEILKNKDIPGLSWKANGAERSITAAYDELTAK